MYRYVHFTHEYQEKGGNYADCRGNYKRSVQKLHICCVASAAWSPNSSVPVEHVHATILRIPPCTKFPINMPSSDASSISWYPRIH